MLVSGIIMISCYVGIIGLITLAAVVMYVTDRRDPNARLMPFIAQNKTISSTIEESD
jgi:hypothetical protein